MEDAFAFRDGWRVVDFANALFAFALAQEQSGRAGMGDDVAADWLFRVYSVSHATARISSNLISHEDCDIELLTDFLQPG